MRPLSTLLLALLCCTGASAATLSAGSEYYIWLNIYEKLLGSNAAGTAPALSAAGKNADAGSYVFVAEASGESGYVLLRQKSTGLYLAASSSNTYSVVFQRTRATTDHYKWKTSTGTDVRLVSKRNTGACLGVDGGNKGSDYVSVYYDKHSGSHASFTVIPATGGSVAAARRAYVSPVYTNAQGVRQVDYIELAGTSVDRSDAVDIHLTANSSPLSGGATVNLGSDRTWLIFDNIQPSTVLSTYLSQVRIQGQPAVSGTNCRVAIYLNGAAVIPLPRHPLTAYAQKGRAGQTFTPAAGNHATLGADNNRMRSFVLRRGYMATLASGQNGSGHSRVYVADHADLSIDLPDALDGRVSSICLRPWQYLSKKGWGNTGGSSGANELRATWFWSWSAAYSSTSNLEYVPCRQHRYWPSASEVNSHTATAAFSVNEPEHSEQHTSSQCSCGGALDAWTCTTLTPDFQAGGGRIGSPQPTDFGWLYDYFGHADDMAYRCDFAVTHAYWDLGGRSAAAYAEWFAAQCKNVWTRTGRPLWLTEMEVSASWNTNKISSYEQNRQYVQALLERLDESPWVERYAIYGTDMWQTYMFYEANPAKGLTPAGQVYRDHRATFAYNSAYTKEPVWWRPSPKKPTLAGSCDAAAGRAAFSIVNPNTDMTATLVLQHRPADDPAAGWQTLLTVDDRALFDEEVVSLAGVDVQGTGPGAAAFRVVATLQDGSQVESDAVGPLSLLMNGGVSAVSKTAVPGWTCTRTAQNGYTKDDSGDTYFEVWNPTAPSIRFDYGQDVSLSEGVYRLTARVFNSTNRETGAEVNGAVGLYAQTSRHSWFAPVTADTEPDGAGRLVLDTLVVAGGTLRVGVRNRDVMAARWAGADDFTLTRLGSTADVMHLTTDDALLAADAALLRAWPLLPDGSRDATRLIFNPRASAALATGWTASNVTFNRGEAWDGDPENAYFDHWKNSAYASALSQDTGPLPEGDYTVSALLRCSDGASLRLQATSGGVTRSTTLAGTGTRPAGPEALPMGWQRVATPPLHVAPGATLTIGLSADMTAGQWWSADDFGLAWQGEVPVGIGAPAAQPAAAAPAALHTLTGQRLAGKPRQPGIYVTRGRKVLVR